MTLACPTVALSPITPAVPTVGTAYSQTVSAAGSTTISTADARSAGQVIAGQRNFGGSQGDLQNLIDLSNRLSIVMGTTATEAAGQTRAERLCGFSPDMSRSTLSWKMT